MAKKRARVVTKGIETKAGIIVKESYCTKCMKTIRADYFYSALDLYILSNGLSSICKPCHMDIYEDLLKEYRNIPDTLLKYCQITNIPFEETIAIEIKELHERQERDGKLKKNPVALYNQRIKMLHKDRDLTGKFYSLDLTFSQEVSRKYRDENEATELIPDAFWGGQYDEVDLEFLEDQYRFFTESTAIENHPEIVFMKQICKKLLYLRNAEFDKDYTLMGKLENELKKLMDSLGITPDKALAAKSGKLQTSFGSWVKEIEKKSPAEWLESEGKPLYEDVDGMETYGYNFITRPLTNFFRERFDGKVIDEETGEMVEGGV